MLVIDLEILLVHFIGLSESSRLSFYIFAFICSFYSFSVVKYLAVAQHWSKKYVSCQPTICIKSKAMSWMSNENIYLFYVHCSSGFDCNVSSLSRQIQFEWNKVHVERMHEYIHRMFAETKSYKFTQTIQIDDRGILPTKKNTFGNLIYSIARRWICNVVSISVSQKMQGAHSSYSIHID